MAKSKIIKELANNEISLDIALNRLFIIASDINNEELQQWAECELHGYGKNKLPDYRYAKNTVFRYSGFNGNCQVKNASLPLLELLKDEDPSKFYLPIQDGIATIEKYIKDSSGHEYGRDLTWMSGMIYKSSGIQCYSIMQIVPINILEGVISTLKMLLIKIFIKLDKTYGCLDDLDINVEIVDDQTVTKTNTIIKNYIFEDKSITIGDGNKIVDSSLK